ncbi:hypothetical protein DICPUDRAFT_146951 [Dictyostelium purpureum]|uniref:Acid ceramidase N-terminal domain-containing protein n=1 Tax=Dictyostelium purpureum TaxID=5786 RepID=F0Z798_DICPU|nr:uncharacterized protein DICPUDRAFT_146951 [Dictyostelium purpureum]EGC40223.1 hypothetical protein DICPUDRAFT_146951 [Dictyostelium purpureum]|eukprot:XP_003283292.1 hypothetical protein DICPUDRAFT_146951 [Dictyostelium purpureum]
MKILNIIFIIQCLIVLINCQCDAGDNPYPIYNEAPVLVNQTEYAKLYSIGPVGNQVNLIELFGTPYQRGFAQGQLLKSQMHDIYDNFFNYITIMVNDLISKYADYLPKFLIDAIEKGGVKLALDITAELTKKHTPEHFFEEMRGLADGSGVAYNTILQLHMFPELIKAACSMVGAYNQSTLNHGLLQLRALDFGFDPMNPLRLHPTVMIYHPEESDGGHDFAVLSWAGFLGTLTGYSQHVGICEKYWFGYNGTSSREGIPFHFLLREIIQYDTSIDEALDRINNAQRTCAVFMGLGSNSTNTFKAVEYSHQYVRVFDDQTPFPAYAPTPAAHPQITDVVYIDKFVQPSNHQCLASVLQKSWGSIDATALINAAAQLQTGDLHIGLYDFAENQFYVSVGTQEGPLGNPNITIVPAYARQFIQVDLNQFFK